MDAPRLAGIERQPPELGSMFSAISWRYDLLNRILSLGQDGRWRAALARAVGPGERVLDLGCGSARSAVADFERSGRGVIGVDLSLPMLERGRTWANARGAAFHPIQGDAFHLPFRDASFDAVTAAFTVRNLVPLPAAAREMLRVLRPGGRLLILESVAPEPGWKAPFHRAYLRWIVPALGFLSPRPAAYRYLSESILDFGSPADVASRLAEAGLERLEVHTRLLGAVAIFLGRRPGESLGSRERAVVSSVQRNPNEPNAAQIAMSDRAGR